MHPLLLGFLMVAAWGVATRRRRMAAAGLAGILLTAWPPLAWLGASSLEAWYSPQPPAMADAGAIVVLAAGVMRDMPARPGPTVKQNTYLRCRYGAWLWKRSRGVPVLLCGGPMPAGPAAAVVMRQAMIEQGVAESMIWTEERSTSTYENAKFGADMLRAKGIGRVVLVTEAYHMLRSERCFRKQGLEVIPAPCNFAETNTNPLTWLPDGEGVLMNETTLHEYIGLGWYLLRGRI